MTDVDREKVLSLVDSWLYANTHDTSFQITDTLSNAASGKHRPMTLSEKIFMHHVLPGSKATGLKAGDVVSVSVDWVLASEVSWKVGWPWLLMSGLLQDTDIATNRA